MQKKKNILVLLGILLSFLIVHSPALAATYYSAPSGSGSACSEGSPCSLNTGLGKLVAGDTLYLRGGTYRQTVSFSKNGSSRNEITISGYPSEKAIIDGEYSRPNHWGRLVEIRGQHVVLRDIEIRRSRSQGLVVSADYVTIRNVYAHHNYENGILFSRVNSSTNSAQYGLVEGCDVSYNNWEWIQGDINSDGNWSSGLTMKDGANYGTMRNNTVYENGGEGLSVYTYNCAYSADNIIVEGNTIYNNWHPNIYLQNTRNTVVKRNLIYNTRTGSETIGGGIQIQNEINCLHNDNNTIINNFIAQAKGGNIVRWYKSSAGGGFTNWLIANNTLVNARGRAGIKIQSGGGASGNEIRNNIVIQEDSLPIAEVPSGYATWSNNCWSKAPPSAAIGTGDIVGNPNLAKTGPIGPGTLTPEYFKIFENSIVRDKAIVINEVTEDFFMTPRGMTPDIGGFEYHENLNNITPEPPTNLRIVAY